VCTCIKDEDWSLFNMLNLFQQELFDWAGVLQWTV
jgi:hypothetical protein